MDCSKTINFFAEAKRLCDSRTGCTADVASKEQCPLFAFCKHPGITRGAEYAKKLIENLQKWSNEHPKKTYAQDFFEKFPKAQSYSDGSPVMCRKIIYGEIRPPFKNCYYTGACKNCWNEPMNDEETKGA
nr:MAG TPA: hypothetical protein [Myoviridae sp. ct5FH28]